MAQNNDVLVSQARNLLNKMKYEIASEVGVNLAQGYNGEVKAKDAGRIGGNMVRTMIQYAENNMK